jgi:hypothetical protein
VGSKMLIDLMTVEDEGFSLGFLHWLAGRVFVSLVAWKYLKKKIKKIIFNVIIL